MSLRVWLVTMQFPVVPEAFAVVEVRALRAQGAEVQVLTLRFGNSCGHGVTPAGHLEGVKIQRPTARATTWAAACFAFSQPSKFLCTVSWMVRKGYRKPGLLLRCAVFLPRILEIFRLAQRAQPEVVHLFWGHYPAVLGYMLQRWLPRVVVSVSLGAYDLVYEFPLSAPVANRADCLWTHAAVNLRALRRLGIDADRCRVLIRGVDLQQIPQNCVPKHGARIVTAGRLVAGKGMHRVLEAFSIVAAEFQQSELVVIGDGPERGRLQGFVRERNLEDRVWFRGNVPHDQVFSELGEASIFMLLSSWESERIPNVVKEAMACGCICIVSDCPGIMEILSCLKEPLIVPGGNSEVAGKLLRAVLTDAARFDGDRARAIQFCRSHLDASRVARERLVAWRSALQRKSRGSG